MDPAFLLLKSAAYGVSLLPLSLAQGFGAALGRLGLALVGDRGGAARENLRLSFPEKDPAWVKATAREAFANLGRAAMECCRLVRVGPDEVSRLCPPVGVENMTNALAKGRGVLMLTGHLGNWEMCGIACSRQVGPIMVVGRPLDFAPADRLVNSFRQRGGNQVVPKARSFRPLLRRLRQGGLVGILGDQNVDWYDGVWVDFFGRPACTNKGMALLSMASGAPVVPVHNFRMKNGRFQTIYGPEIPPAESGDKTQDIWDNTQAYTKAIEDMIRRDPAQWLWAHKRWKTKPQQPWPREKDS